jgi:LPXTG-site transpeptidase (sortase) family protein
MAYDFWEERKAEKIVMQTAQILYELIEQNKEKIENDDELDENMLPQVEQTEEAVWQADQTIPKVIEFNSELYIGVLHIPSLSLHLPINNGLSSSQLRQSPCRYSGDITNSLVILGHNYRSHLGRLSRVSRGETLIITDAVGYEHNYTVEEVVILNVNDLESITQKPYDLIIITCTLIETERLAVRCIAPNRNKENPVSSPVSSENFVESVYRKISAEEAREIMETTENYILLDVRTEEEYKEKRIEGATLIPDYEITNRVESELPDKNAVILIYCQSGRRSESAAKELANMGYTNVYDLGGILDWSYETVSS